MNARRDGLPAVPRFFPPAKRISGDDSLAEDARQVSWIKILQDINQARTLLRCRPAQHGRVAVHRGHSNKKRIDTV